MRTGLHVSHTDHVTCVQVCIRTMSKCDTVIPLIYAMKKRKDCVHVAAETIKKLYDPPIPELVDQVSNPW